MSGDLDDSHYPPLADRDTFEVHNHQHQWFCMEAIGGGSIETCICGEMNSVAPPRTDSMDPRHGEWDDSSEVVGAFGARFDWAKSRALQGGKATAVAAAEAENNGGDPTQWSDDQRRIFGDHDTMMRSLIEQQAAEAAMLEQIRATGRGVFLHDDGITPYGHDTPELGPFNLLCYRGLVLELDPNTRYRVRSGMAEDGPWLEAHQLKQRAIGTGPANRKRKRRR